MTSSPGFCGGALRSSSDVSTRFTSAVGTRCSRPSATSRIRSRIRRTRWPVSADDVDERHVPEERRLLDQLVLPPPRGVGVLLLDQVPLVHHDDQPAAVVPRLGGDPEILVVHAQRGIDHQHADLGPLDGALGPERGVELQIIFYFSATT